MEWLVWWTSHVLHTLTATFCRHKGPLVVVLAWIGPFEFCEILLHSSQYFVRQHEIWQTVLIQKVQHFCKLSKHKPRQVFSRDDNVSLFVGLPLPDVQTTSITFTIYNNYHEMLYRHSWSPEDSSSRLPWSPNFFSWRHYQLKMSLCPIIWFMTISLSCTHYCSAN